MPALRPAPACDAAERGSAGRGGNFAASRLGRPGAGVAQAPAAVRARAADAARPEQRVKERAVLGDAEPEQQPAVLLHHERGVQRDLLADARKRLALYQAHKPYRETKEMTAK